MNATVYILILAAVFCVQLALSLMGRCTTVKCIPTIVILALMLVSFLCYWLSGWTNWGWLIFMLLEAGALVPTTLAAVLGAIEQKSRK